MPSALTIGSVANVRLLPRVLVEHSRQMARILRRMPAVRRGFDYGSRDRGNPARVKLVQPRDPGFNSDVLCGVSNPLVAFVESHKVGRGIWKWSHYFDIYHRHFSRFQESEVSVLEVGVYSGGSLEMWREYFGPQSRIFGVDIEPACKVYENEYTRVFIGDQGDREFWRLFKEQVPVVDIVIDDGGHRPEQQIVTLEEMLPHIRPGGVYVCEDIHGVPNGFAAYISGLAYNLHALSDRTEHGVIAQGLQSWIGSITIHPYVAVIEKLETPLDQFGDSKYGTEWQPFSGAGS